MSETLNADALLAEVKATGKTFTLGGHEFFVLPPSAWPDDAVAAAATSDAIAVSRAVLGDEQYKLFVDAGGGAAFFDRIITALYGSSPGESSASSSS